MPDARAPSVYTIPIYRSFSDALVTGVLAQHGNDRLSLAQGVILVPNNRAARAITDGFVRRAERGLLLPRIIAIGDAGETPGLGIEDALEYLPPAVDALTRQMILARSIQQERAVARTPVSAAEAIRLAGELGGVIDELIAEDKTVADLRTLDVEGLAVHWETSLALFATVIERWPEELSRLGAIDLPERRNRLLRGLARRWRDAPPTSFVIAAGVTSAAPAIAELLGTVARLPHGSVVLPGFDLTSPDPEWQAIVGDDDHRGIESHPQHHLALLLSRMKVARKEVRNWRWGDGRPTRTGRRRVVANAFVPAAFTDKWVGLPGHLRALPGVRIAEFASVADEAQGIAIALREAVEVLGRTAALVTPDRVLAARVAAHLQRWNILADDSAGRPLSRTPAGTLLQAVAQLGVERFAPVALLAVLKHPLVSSGEGRASWLDGVRTLDRALRGPRPAAGLAGIEAFLRAPGRDDARDAKLRGDALDWWGAQAPRFGAFEQAFAAARPRLGDLLAAIFALVEDLSGDAAWRGPDGRCAAQLIADLAARADVGPADFAHDDIMPLLRLMMDAQAIRPPQGGHPRVAIYGLIEARLQSADLTILGGLNEGVWPGVATTDPWLSPMVRRKLGLADPDRRVGLAAHDFGTALGAAEVLLTRAERDATAATNPSRFVLRLDAMTGGLARDTRLPALAVAIDANPGRAQPVAKPAPVPPVADRPKRISVTRVDRLKADPFAFYAQSMLRLSQLDRIDGELSPAWKGTAVHAVFDAWTRHDDFDPARLRGRIDRLLAGAGIHPLVRVLWRARIAEAVDWIAAEVVEARIAGRVPLKSEVEGTIELAGIRLTGKADRIDRLADGALAIIDYKTGAPPKPKWVEAGYAMQLGLLAAIARRGGFPEVAGEVGALEYWSLRKDGDVFGKISTPVAKGEVADAFIARAEAVFAEAAATWLTGDAPFVAKLNDAYAPYTEYDQLMRLEEWYASE